MRLKSPLFEVLLILTVVASLGATATADTVPGLTAPTEPATAPAGEPGVLGGEDDSPHIIVGPSSKDLDPLAIFTPSCEGDASSSTCTSIEHVIKRDMEISAFFKILKKKTFLADPAKETLTETEWPNWFNIGAKYLVKGTVVGKGGSFEVSLRLYNVLKKKTYTLKGQDFTATKDTLRGKVHEFCNQILWAVSGTAGLFDTKILYVAKGKNKEGQYQKSVVIMDLDGYNKKYLVGDGNINMFPSMGKGGDLIYTKMLQDSSQGKPAIFYKGVKLSGDDSFYLKGSVSPDGSVIAVSVDVGDGQSDIWLMSKTGKLIKNLTKHPAIDVTPVWSPDGSKLAFVSDRSGGPQIYVMGKDGGKQTRVTMAGQYNTEPSWGVNGKIAFVGLDESVANIYTIDLGTGIIEKITQNQGRCADPWWSPDGRYLVFVTGDGFITISNEDGSYQFPISLKPGAYATPFWVPSGG